jgi:hypothetical protein
MAKSCEHLAGLTPEDFPPQRTPNACEECLVEGTFWVALRECQSCGHVGCCDSSTSKHATRHTSMRHNILSCVLFRLRLGYGAMSSVIEISLDPDKSACSM